MDREALPKRPPLEPLSYHRHIVQHLKAHESEVWAWSASQAERSEEAREVRAALLRETYRLDSAAHPEVHADCAAVMKILEIEAPATLYQAADGAMNAALFFVPGEAHLIFHGPVLERLSREERVALIGHELAHYKLWSIEDGAFHIAHQILDHALAYPGAAPAHFETARLYRLHTELYADRGGALVADQPAPAIATLIKTMTGIATVDADAYLRQAAELDASPQHSQGVTHPEIFLRAQAVDKWWRSEVGLEEWLAERIQGPLSMRTLDLRRQHELTRLTRGFLARLAGCPAAKSEAIGAEFRRYFADWSDEAPIELSALNSEAIDDSVRDYLVALIFDVAMADPDAKDEILRAGADIARAMKAEEMYRGALSRDLRMPKRNVTKLFGASKKA